MILLAFCMRFAPAQQMMCVEKDPVTAQNIVAIPSCPREMYLSHGDTHKCSLPDVLHVVLNEDGTKLFLPECAGDVIKLCRRILIALQQSIFVTRIDVLCESSDELEFWQNGEKVNDGESRVALWNFALPYWKLFTQYTARLWNIERPAANKFHFSTEMPSCEVAKGSSLTIRRKIPEADRQINIIVACNQHVDRQTISLIIVFLALTLLGPFILCNPLSRTLICVIFGSLVALMLFSYFIFRDVTRTTLGRIGVATAVFFGSIGAFSEGLVRTIVPWVISSARNDRSLQFGGIATGVAVVAVFRYFNLQKYIMALSYGLLRLLQALVLAFAFSSNKALCISSVVVPISMLAVSFLARIAFTKNYGSAKDSFPAYVYKESNAALHHVSDTLTGTPDEKMMKYNLEGRIHTRRQLEKLSEDIRANVKVVTRTYDPNSIAHWAGVG